MVEMHERNKWAFWTLIAAGAVAICVPSAVMLDAVGRYEAFLTGFEPRPLRPIMMRGTPRPASIKEKDVAPALEFADFKLKAPRAKKVSLVGDFNAWKAGTLPCAKMKDGSWELTLPLPPGKYRYRFVVDGDEKTDPNNEDHEDVSGRSASVRTIR